MSVDEKNGAEPDEKSLLAAVTWDGHKSDDEAASPITLEPDINKTDGELSWTVGPDDGND